MKQYGLIGYPLGHSFSKRFFTEKFLHEHINAIYSNFEIEQPEKIIDIINEKPDLCGLNCTIPHKESIIPLLDEISEQAKKIGAVNVIKIIQKDGRTKLIGHNSDIIGFTESIKPLLKPHHKKALILGTGGASKAVCAALDNLNIKWTLVSRNEGANKLTYTDITEVVLREHTLVINCSPVGMFPHEDKAPELPYQALTPLHLLYDLVYNPEETLFLKSGKAAGATTKNGLEMLELQALASWKIWNSQCNTTE